MTSYRCQFRDVPDYSSDEVVEAVAEAIWSVDAPRYGNDVFPWADVHDGRRVQYIAKSRAALRCLEQRETEEGEHGG